MQPLSIPEDLLTAGRIAAAATLLVLCGSPRTIEATTQAPDVPVGPIEVVLDASGSMRGRLEAVEKMTVAKEFLAALREEFGGDGVVPPMGLSVYGAGSDRQLRDCRDTARLITPADSLVGWDAALAAVRPLGVSPLATALERALAAAAVTYILVTDGADNCGRDACTVWRERGIPAVETPRPRLHVVALDPGPVDLERLRCLSRAGSGSLIQLGSRADVPSAARRLALVLRNRGLLDVRLVLGEGAEFSAPVRVLEPLTRELVTAFVSGQPVAVPAGMYNVIVETAPPIRADRVLVLPGEVAVVEERAFGTLTVDLLDLENQPLRTSVSISRTGDPAELRFASTGDSLILAEGLYDVRVDMRDSFAVREAIAVEPRRPARIVLGGSGTLTVIAPGSNAPATPATVFGHGRSDSLAIGLAHELPAGEYRVTVRSIPPYVAEAVVVEPTRDTTVELPETGVLEVDVFEFDTLAGGVEIAVIEPVTEERYGTLSSGERRLAMPGTYRLELKVIPPTTIENVAIEPAEITVIEQRGLSRIELSDAITQGNTDLRLEVLDASDRALAIVNAPQPSIPVWPGSYRVRVWRADELVWEGPITVAGDRPARINSTLPAQGEGP
jgi:hypothetical protein